MKTPDVKSKETDRSAQNEALLSAAGLDVLGALRTGIVCVLADGTISAVNDAAAEAPEADDGGTDLLCDPFDARLELV